MRRTIFCRGGFVLLFLAACIALSPPPLAADVFRARMLTGKAPVEPAAVSIRIEIQSYTTPEEVQALQETLNQGGMDAFLKAFQNMKKGVVRIMDRRGWNLPVHAALVVPAKKGRKVLCFMLRQAWDPGSQLVRTGADFFMVLELSLNEKGTGDGRLYEDAGIKLQPQAGTIEMDKYGSAPKVLIQASQVGKNP
jgi:hypothetical protein